MNNFDYLDYCRPKSGSLLLYSRKKVRYRRDGYCWKKRKDGKTTREDHMKLKVQGTEVSRKEHGLEPFRSCTIRQLAGIVFQLLPSFVKGWKKKNVASISRTSLELPGYFFSYFMLDRVVVPLGELWFPAGSWQKLTVSSLEQFVRGKCLLKDVCASPPLPANEISPAKG